MKKLILILILALFLGACAQNKTIDGITYRPYGLLNEKDAKNDSIHYEISVNAVITSVIFCEVIFPPIYSVGFNLWEPISKKSKQNPILKGVVQ